MTVGRENQEMISKTRTMSMETYLFVFAANDQRTVRYLSHASSVLNELAAATKRSQVENDGSNRIRDVVVAVDTLLEISVCQLEFSSVKQRNSMRTGSL